MFEGSRHRARAGACAALCAALAFVSSPAGTAAAKSAPRRPAASSYPAGATRPALIPRRSEFARPARAGARSAAARRHKRARRRKKGPVLHGDAARALVAFQAMQRNYYVAGSGLYAGEPFSYLWPFSQALAATVSVARIPHVPGDFKGELHQRMVGLRSYLDTNNSGDAEGTFTSTLPAFDGTVAPPIGPGGTKYYDDNDWIGIELVRVFALTHNTAVLSLAQAIMSFEMAAWQTDPQLPCPGGIPFSNDTANTDRNTVTAAPAAELALQLYRQGGNVQYLRFAETAYEWVRGCLALPGGLYADHINNQGVVDGTLWSYVQGTMIGAGTMLYQASGNRAFLEQARQTAAASLAYFTPERLGGEIPFFPSVFFRNLLYLGSVVRLPAARPLAQSYVDYAWLHLRLANGLFVAGSPPSAQLLVQSAIAQIYALLSTSPSTYF
jgi:hypothetical protein